MFIKTGVKPYYEKQYNKLNFVALGLHAIRLHHAIFSYTQENGDQLNRPQQSTQKKGMCCFKESESRLASNIKALKGNSKSVPLLVTLIVTGVAGTLPQELCEKSLLWPGSSALSSLLSEMESHREERFTDRKWQSSTGTPALCAMSE